MGQPRHRFIVSNNYRCIVLVLVGLLLGIAMTIMVVDAPNRTRTRQQQELQAAQARWKAHNIDHYRLRLEREYIIGLPIPPPCHQDVRVVQGAIVDIVDTEQSYLCDSPPPTVEDLFHEAKAFLQDDTGTISGIVRMQSPLCHSRSTVTLLFHPDLGYPLLIEQRISMHPDWLNLNTWQVWINTGHPPPCYLWNVEPTVRSRVLELIPER